MFTYAIYIYIWDFLIYYFIQIFRVEELESNYNYFYNVRKHQFQKKLLNIFWFPA